MTPLLRVAAGLVRLFAARATRRIAVASGIFAMALLFALVGFAGFAAALWIWLARTLDPISAALMIGGGGFVVSALVLLVAGRPRRPQSLFSAAEAEQLLAEVKARQSTVALWTPLIGVALIGYLLGSKSKD